MGYGVWQPSERRRSGFKQANLLVSGKCDRQAREARLPDEELELPSWAGSIVDDSGEVTSENFEDWLRVHWAADIEFDL